MPELEKLLEEADNLGILNIDVDGQLTPDIIKIAIEATNRLNSRLDKDIIKKKLQEADRVIAAQHR